MIVSSGCVLDKVHSSKTYSALSCEVNVNESMIIVNKVLLNRNKNRKQLLHLEEIPDNELDENFKKQSKVFCSYIYTHAKTKTLKEGITITGKSEPPLLQHVSL